jgi:hypothetical protein
VRQLKRKDICNSDKRRAVGTTGATGTELKEGANGKGGGMALSVMTVESNSGEVDTEGTETDL